MTELNTFYPVDIVAGDRGLPARVFAYGFSFRKRSIVRRFIGQIKVQFIQHVKHLSIGNFLLLWGSTAAPAGLMSGVKIVRLEDGFLRSVGLGADLIHPISWVIDHQGIYYDATRPSDLEDLLQTTEFSPALLERAAELRGRIVKSGLTKYNVGSNRWQRPAGVSSVILVTGQVETDASIQYGAPGVRTNMGLLQAVRKANPDAYVVYKPHPDVVAGLRARGQAENEAQCWCDEIITNVAMGEILTAVDEVHVLTSLAGFEALLRDKKVTCYGQPFYSGWGLTKDMLPVSRRTRRLSLDALVAGTMIRYPIYVSRITGRFITPEQAMSELIDWRTSESGQLTGWRRLLRMVLQIYGRLSEFKR